MSIEITEDEKQEGKAALSSIISDLPEEPGLSLKPSCYCMSGEEIEGEVIETVSNYMKKRKCPDAIIATFAREIAEEILQGSLTECELDQELELDEAPVKQYESAKLAKVILSTMAKVGKRWTETLPPIHRNNIHYPHCVMSIKNKRRKMEDKHSIVPHFNASFGIDKSIPPCALFSVYDGHGGTDAALYSASQFAIHLRSSMHEKSDLKDALNEAFLKTDQGFVEKAKRERLRSGCTGVSALITKTKMYIGWIGDSQVVLCKGNGAFQLMNPHKPDREDERSRIEALGGCVVWFGGWRVNGSLAVSRAIGDYEQKPYVSGDPDIVEYTFSGDEKFLILGCDGLFDVIETEKIVQKTLNWLEEGIDRDNIAEMLVNEAKACGSMDNITVLVVYLDDHVEKLMEGYIRTAEFEQRPKLTADLSEYDVLEVADVSSSNLNGEIIDGEEIGRKYVSVSNDLSELKLCKNNVENNKATTNTQESSATIMKSTIPLDMKINPQADHLIATNEA